MAYPPTYAPTSTYAARIPSPPRILIPAHLPDSRVTTESIPYSNPPSTCPIAQVYTSASLDWTYTQRRSAQPILPHLYLGPIQAAKDIPFLRTANITLLLGIRQSNPFQLAAHKKVAQLASELHIPSATVEADTLPQLISSFAHITSIINTHTSSLPPGKGRVLLFCESGNDRSAGACAAYLMSVLEGVDHVKAMQLVQGQRFCCNFDEALKRLLQGYWDIIRAEREVGGMGYLNLQPRPDAGAGAGGGSGEGDERGRGRGAKRGRERDTEAGAEQGEGQEMEMETEMDEERFGGRSWVPFVDTGN